MGGATAPRILEEKPVIRTVNAQSRKVSVLAAVDQRGSSCVECHVLDSQLSHPVDIVPPGSMTVPASLPLVNGKVTCVTCHSVSAGEHTTGQGAASDFLRAIDAGSGLCSQCHDSTGISAQDMHAVATRRAHLPQAKSASSRLSDSPDWASANCLSCHDGAMASDVSAVSGIAGAGLFNMRSTGHPVGVSYQLSDPRGADGTLKSPAMMDDRIRLFNNRVECGSCHSLYSAETKLLVISNDRSELCLSCHEY